MNLIKNKENELPFFATRGKSSAMVAGPKLTTHSAE